MMQPKHILISRTDSIGDVILTLPLCAALKKHIPNLKISFLGKSYTQAVIESYTAIDQFIDWSEWENKDEKQNLLFLSQQNIDTVIHVFPNKAIGRLCKKAGIKNRIGTSHRFHHWFTCNIKPNFTRKNSNLHEAQLNFKLAVPLGIKFIPTIADLIESTAYFQPKEVLLPSDLTAFLNQAGETILLHPKSQGSALEWPIDKYIETANELINKGKKVIFTGTEKEGVLFRSLLPTSSFLFDSTGKLSLPQLIHLIQRTDALVACSTGPLHIAAFCGNKAIGLFSSRKPIHPARWQPVGKHAQALVFDPNCIACSKGEVCHCIEKIPVSKVTQALL